MTLRPRAYLVQLIGVRGSEATGAISDLVNVLQNDASAVVRMAAASALGDIGVSTEKVVVSLAEVVKERGDDDVRLNAIISLGELGPSVSGTDEFCNSAAGIDSRNTSI